MPKLPDIKRRTLVKGLTLSSLVPVLGANLLGCSDGSDNPATLFGAFLHGVASGDPLPDRVILWTRVTPDEPGMVGVSWEVATDAGFSNIVTSGSGTTSEDVDYTVKVDASGLEPGSRYFYRFSSGSTVSPTGSTRTLPEGAVAAASFAVLSCSNYPVGYFHVYREVANANVDAVVHTGDYIYEYTGGGDLAEELGRVSQPPRELLSLQDYRTRYAQYRTDADLQAAHAAHPFLVVWDDHEVANNTWREGAENHNPETEGSFEERKMVAIQAWYEWLPVRPPSNAQDIIYRSFRYGDLLDLLMLDTRVVGRDEQYLYTDFATDGSIDVERARAAFGAADRTLLGPEQLAWLREQLQNSSALWQVLGQQVLLGRYHLPSLIMEALDPSLGTEDAINKGILAVLATLDALRAPPDERTSEQEALLASAIPYNLDAWDGYEFERDQLLTFAHDLGSKLVVLSGDTHNAWSTQLTTPQGDIAGVEFGGTSVSSTGLENALGEEAATFFSPIIAELIEDLRYADLKNRGYLVVEFTPQTVTAEHRFVDTVRSTEYSVVNALTRRFLVNRADMVLV